MREYTQRRTMCAHRDRRRCREDDRSKCPSVSTVRALSEWEKFLRFHASVAGAAGACWSVLQLHWRSTMTLPEEA